MVDLAVITGPDNTGKTALARHLHELVKDYPSVELASLTHYEYSSFFLYRQMGKLFRLGTKMGDRLNSRYLAALNYGAMLYMHKRLMKRCESKNKNVIHMRHPGIDSKVYAGRYFRNDSWFNRFVRDKVIPYLSSTLEPATPIIYLKASLDTILERSERSDETRQMHEIPEDLTEILNSYATQLKEFENAGHRVIVIDTDTLQLDDVITAVGDEILNIINEQGLKAETRSKKVS